MKHRVQFAFLALVLAMLACSPSAVVNDILGTAPSPTPTAVAQVETQTPTASTEEEATPEPTSVVTSTAPAATATTAPTSGPSSTPAPVLPLRDDLPALALKDWPRPANDNGRCIHFLPTGYFSQQDFDIQRQRLQGLQMRWVLAIYSDENQLKLAAQNFKKIGVVPVWRRLLRADQHYYDWARDIQILKDAGLPPYFQLFNEPGNQDEWASNTQPNMDQWVANFIGTAKDLYNAGGYVGLQVTDTDLLTKVLEGIKAAKGDRLFGRMFFVAHSYALNHPPNYVEDENGVLGWRMFLPVFQQEMGFVPPIIVGEGGWKIGEEEDNRFPKVDDTLEAQYYVDLFNWFRPPGKLSNGDPLPDYLFAFCPWLLAANTTAGAWYDGFEGNRDATIAAVKKMGTFVRQSSWSKK